MRSIKTNQTYCIYADPHNVLYYVPCSRLTEFREDLRSILQSEFESKWSGYEIYNCDKVILLDVQSPDPPYVFPAPCFTDWNEVDEKYKYRAFDEDGELFYYIEEPVLNKEEGFWTVDPYVYSRAGKASERWASKIWRNSLEQRPESQTTNQKP
jgi:hypothetical protein